MKSRIFHTKPSITDLEVRYATDAAANGCGNQCIGRGYEVIMVDTNWIASAPQSSTSA